jgi:hypothetical protein
MGCSNTRLLHEPFKCSLLAGDKFWRISDDKGFLPSEDPLEVLPEEYSDIEKLMQELPYSKPDGSYGLIHEGKVGKTV